MQALSYKHQDFIEVIKSSLQEHLESILNQVKNPSLQTALRLSNNFITYNL